MGGGRHVRVYSSKWSYHSCRGLGLLETVQLRFVAYHIQAVLQARSYIVLLRCLLELLSWINQVLWLLNWTAHMRIRTLSCSRNTIWTRKWIAPFVAITVLRTHGTILRASNALIASIVETIIMMRGYTSTSIFNSITNWLESTTIIAIVCILVTCL